MKDFDLIAVHFNAIPGTVFALIAEHITDTRPYALPKATILMQINACIEFLIFWIVSIDELMFI